MWLGKEEIGVYVFSFPSEHKTYTIHGPVFDYRFSA